MNVVEINPQPGSPTIRTYVAVALPLTIFTGWILIAFQSKDTFLQDASFIKRLAWPIFLIAMIWKKPKPIEEKSDILPSALRL